MQRLYFLLFFLITTIAAQAQGLPGYVITPAGDSVLGWVAEKPHGRIHLYSSAGGGVQTFQASQVKAYGLLKQPAIRSRVVRMASGSDSVCFVLPNQVGRVSSYSFANETGLLLQPATTDTLYQLTAFNWHLLFTRYLTECSTLFSSDTELLDTRFTFSNTEQIIQRYNRCFNTGTPHIRSDENSPWRHGLGFRLGAQRLMLQNTLSKQFLGLDMQADGAGWSQLIGFEWTAVRANGLQVNLSGSYAHWSITTGNYLPQPVSSQPTIELEQQTEAHFLHLSAAVGKRLGRPSRPHFYVVGALGSGYLLQATSTQRQRPAGSSLPFQRLGTSSAKGSPDPSFGTTHIGAEAGWIVPLDIRHELRLAATYQKYIFFNMQAVGAQVAYTWFRK
ncbi:hypothetical protein DNI29_10015 [Hymenobacter sediminis]|uniref:hypothetical protein n=1 Tax=Hymenobacter sediminis TaxID=2218621 RepID=UPI000F4E4550|nr:hypothetical protein [Hymenobacter sediminis]RPD47770.1 hypothetical protein DNI29_10015 [Hymenobacter sediminis]